MGLAFGAIEVSAPAAADRAGHAGAAGLLLGGWGLGSFVGGVLATRASAPPDPVRRLCLLLALLTCGHLLLALPHQLILLGGVLFLSGAAIAPAFGLAYGLVERAAAAGTVTEAYTWLSTGLAAGIAAARRLRARWPKGRARRRVRARRGRRGGRGAHRALRRASSRRDKRQALREAGWQPPGPAPSSGA